MQNPNAYDLVILDANMPYLDGRSVLAEMRKLNSNVCAILATGDCEAGHSSDGFRGVLFKPCRIHTLCEIVQRAINGNED